MSNPRQDRLRADYAKLQELQSASPIVAILQTFGDPPESYVISIKCRGITRLDLNGTPQYCADHRLKIDLPPTYPRNIPSLRMLTPVWHPNIDLEQGWICLGHEGENGYAPSMSLSDLVIRIIQIIRYENYSREYFLNENAFNWAKQNPSLFPLDDSPILEEQVEINIVEENADIDLLNEISIL